ncbi:hypothetical protein [Methylobacterium sp. J-067]|uniref:hypothetical protein n=1 Tax=Methylobacterium sp. J-067 TaxID=2836648 RepID=UPI001FB91318|nr:hypothetical protein [Methylobacterium sp. J-067]MCJ2023931.1 hypothetical protein [Methylobacterium sp. J-067]
MNVKTPGACQRTRAFGNGVVFAADPSEIAHPASKIQTDHLRQRFNLSPAVAAVIAAHAFAVAETWRASQ